MFRIRRIQDALSVANQRAVAQAMEVIRTQLPSVTADELARLPDQLTHPFKYRYHSVLFVAEGALGRLRGFAVLLHLPDVKAAYLEYISAALGSTNRGIGGSLYESVQEEAVNLGAKGLFLECSVDDPELVDDPQQLKQNCQRMAFYERRGARPIINNDYCKPLHAGDCDLYHLMVAPLGSDEECLRAAFVRKLARAVMERKYASLYKPEQIEAIVASFRDDPVTIREPRYVRRPRRAAVRGGGGRPRIALLVNGSYDLHHVRDKGYVETPVRIPTILKAILPTTLFEQLPAQKVPRRLLTRVHRPEFVRYMRTLYRELPADKAIYPEVFPIRNSQKPPLRPELKLGYYCIDGFTPMSRNAYTAACEAVDCAVTGAMHILDAYHLAYALIRPPGHHAESRCFGGFCYFNSAAVAAEYLSDYGRVAVLDVDHHHGNGTQDIFYHRADVLTVSIHGDPRFVYPHFAGFRTEKGQDAGLGFNVNYPLPEHITAEQYFGALRKAIKRILAFRPDYLVLSLGLDTAKADPTGTWPLQTREFRKMGQAIGAMHLRTVVVQEGGYRTRTLGVNARHFFDGLWEGHHGRPADNGGGSRRA